MEDLQKLLPKTPSKISNEMPIRHWILPLIFSFAWALTFARVDSSWEWTWSCVNRSCLKNAVPDDGQGTTLELCKLTCGDYGSIWPKPTGRFSMGKQLFAFHPSKIKFGFSNVEGESATVKYLQEISEVFQDKMTATCGPNCHFVPETEVIVIYNVTSSNFTLNWKTDESYFLRVSQRENIFESDCNCSTLDVIINSKSVYGARHALETFAQMTTFQASSEDPKKTSLVAISSAKITDSPSYPHRGLLLDTARNYIPVPVILKTLDAMAMTKLNVLHWHATDSQSFPLEIPSVPQLTRYGAYSANMIYTVEDTKTILKRARLNGIRVIIEIDGPAHAGNGWQWGETLNLDKLALCVNQQPWRKHCIQPPCGQLNPVNPNVFFILKKIFSDLIELLPPGEAFHMGGDEVFFPCWNSSTEVVKWMEENNLTRTEEDFINLWGIYQENVLRSFSESNPVPEVPVILWSSSLTEPDVIEKYLDKNRYIIQTWLPAASPIPRQLLDKGYRLIMTTKDKWYLDHGFWGKTLYHGWKEIYDNKLPLDCNVLGGEAAMWSERVDENSLDAKVWPRAAAIAERLWTNPETDANEAEPRFEQFRERLVKCGIKADVTNPYYCYQNEKECA